MCIINIILIRLGRAIVPVSIRGIIVQIRVERSNFSVIVRVATEKHETSAHLFPISFKVTARAKYLPLCFANSPSQVSGLQDRDAPLFQLANEAALSRLEENAPTLAPLPERPPKSTKRAPELLNH